jgi:hypothetical protein
VLLPTLLGVLAGITTTVAGLGGGHLLLLGLAVLWTPLDALATTGPALLLGNLHRVFLFRDGLDAPLVGRYVLGAFPGALVGGMLAGRIPTGVLLKLMALLAAIGVARQLFDGARALPAWSLVPGGVVVGGVAATGGGAGALAGPLLMGSGATGARYMSAMASGAAAVHIGRLLGYGAEGHLAPHHVGWGLVLAGSLLAGNLIGLRMRRRLLPRTRRHAELAAVVVALGLAISAACSGG